MEKNYNYNYENRANAKSKGGNVTIGSLQSASCKSSELKNQAVCNGRLWHTTDTNKFYFDWNGKRQELNVSGDNAALESEIAKIKADMKNLNPDAVQSKLDQLETKVNNAASQANTAKTAAQTAQQQATQAAQDAQDAAAQVSSKADVSYVDDAVSHAFDNLTDAQKEELRGPAGAAGKDGKDGVDGQNGQDGKDGVDGLPGKDGKDGEDGLSAYDVAVAAGFNGTVEAWLESLKGADGKDGVDGAPGKDGKDGEGITAEDRAKLDAIPDDLVQGAFPDGSDPEGSDFTPGLATVQDVIEYVNALIEKKKDELGPVVVGGVPYAYITGYALNGTPTDITVFNPFELNEDGDTEIEIYAGEEITTYSPSTYEDLPSVKLTVDIPNGYYIKESYIWNDDLGADGDYELMDGVRAFDVNPRYTSRVMDGVTYNSYVRGPVNDTAASPANEKYKIIITKQ